jgi:hypothetical protein
MTINQIILLLEIYKGGIEAKDVLGNVTDFEFLSKQELFIFNDKIEAEVTEKGFDLVAALKTIANLNK